MSFRSLRVSVPSAFVLLISVPAFAQVTSRLSGSVVDPSGSAIPGAAVDIYLPEGARPILSTTTTAEGIFAFTGVAAGNYDLVISANGFRKYTARAVPLTAAAETSL